MQLRPRGHEFERAVQPSLDEFARRTFAG
jgi:hypothetical protein